MRPVHSVEPRPRKQWRVAVLVLVSPFRHKPPIPWFSPRRRHTGQVNARGRCGLAEGISSRDWTNSESALAWSSKLDTLPSTTNTMIQKEAAEILERFQPSERLRHGPPNWTPCRAPRIPSVNGLALKPKHAAEQERRAPKLVAELRSSSSGCPLSCGANHG